MYINEKAEVRKVSKSLRFPQLIQMPLEHTDNSPPAMLPLVKPYSLIMKRCYAVIYARIAFEEQLCLSND